MVGISGSRLHVARRRLAPAPLARPLRTAARWPTWPPLTVLTVAMAVLVVVTSTLLARDAIRTGRQGEERVSHVARLAEADDRLGAVLGALTYSPLRVTHAPDGQLITLPETYPNAADARRDLQQIAPLLEGQDDLVDVVNRIQRSLPDDPHVTSDGGVPVGDATFGRQRSELVRARIAIEERLRRASAQLAFNRQSSVTARGMVLVLACCYAGALAVGLGARALLGSEPEP